MKGGKSKADATKKAESKLSVKKKGGEKGKPVKKGKAGKDPNKPKRPPSAFFCFMEDFRESFKKKNPNEKKIAVIGKASGAKWKSLTDAEKVPYQNTANKRKAEYEKKMDAYNNKEVVAEEEEESDKSKSEVNDDEEGSDEDGDEEEDDD